MNQQEITHLLPNRPPMLLVDEAQVDGDSIVGCYTVRGDECFLQGHFPSHPVVPAGTLCEMMSQCGAMLLGSRLHGTTPFFTGLDDVRFRHSVVPGDTVVFTTRLTNHKGLYYFLQSEGRVGERVCVSGKISFAMIRRRPPQPA